MVTLTNLCFHVTRSYLVSYIILPVCLIVLQFHHFLKVYRRLSIDEFGVYKDYKPGFIPSKFIYKSKKGNENKYWWILPVAVAITVSLSDAISTNIMYIIIVLMFTIVSYVLVGIAAVNTKYYKMCIAKGIGGVYLKDT